MVDSLPALLSQRVFDDCVAVGAAMELAEAVHYTRHQIQLARQELLVPPDNGAAIDVFGPAGEQ